MALDHLQDPIYFVLLILAGLTAVLGFLLVHHLKKIKSEQHSDRVVSFTFNFLAWGYSLFALAEISWYLIFGYTKQLPSASIPELYWILGSFVLLMGFIYFSVAMHKEHGKIGKGLTIMGIAGIISGVVLYLILSSTLSHTKAEGIELFLIYFYPILSTLILVFSINVYLFFDKIKGWGTAFFLLVTANIANLAADLTFNYSGLEFGYGTLSLISDGLYTLGYLLCVIAFGYLILKVRSLPKE